MQAKKKNNPKEEKEDALKPDPKTLHTTDPQEKMEGPISSIVQNIKEGAEEDNDKEKTDEKK
jgi:hypothetical protein